MQRCLSSTVYNSPVGTVLQKFHCRHFTAAVNGRMKYVLLKRPLRYIRIGTVGQNETEDGIATICQIHKSIVYRRISEVIHAVYSGPMIQ
jgi:hypothetical protein